MYLFEHSLSCKSNPAFQYQHYNQKPALSASLANRP